MAKSYEEFRTHGKEMVDYICDYVKNIEEKVVYPVTLEPGFLHPLLPKEAPQEPESFEKVLEDFDKKIMPGVLHWNHPDFFAYFGNGRAYPGVMGDMLGGALGVVGFSWASCPSITELEGIVLDWFAKALHLPDFLLSKNSNPKSLGGGSIQGSASDAIYACMCSARARAIKKLKGNNHDIHDSSYLPQLVCYSSSEAHSCVEKAAKVLMVKFRAIEPDSHDTMRGEALEKAVKEDVERGLTPFFVCATVGTTGQVAFDNLEEIGQVCQKYPSMWFHVDGAYGGNSFILPEMRKYMQGIEYVDSIEINPNKLMLTAFDSTCLWVKNVLLFTEAFAIDPVYLHHQHDTSVVDLRHYGIPLSRRFRSLKLYFMLRMYGIKGLQAYVRRVIAMGQHFEKLVKADKRFEVRNDVICGLVCFRLLQPDCVNERFLARMNESGRIHMIPAVVKGKYIIRFIAGQEDCNEAQIEKAWGVIQEFADEILNEITEPCEKKARVELKSLENTDLKKLQRFSFTRKIPQELYHKHAKVQKLGDGATPLISLDMENV